MTTRARERREAIAEQLCDCQHAPHVGACAVVVGRQSTLDGDTIPSWCACDLRTAPPAPPAPPSLPGFGNASEEHRS